MTAFVAPIALLLASNIFMTFAWYGHMRFPNAILWQVVLISWGIAFFEYTLAVPANRLGHGTFTAAQLKVIQEVIALAAFAVFALFYLGEPIRWNYAAACLCVVAAVFFIMYF